MFCNDFPKELYNNIYKIIKSNSKVTYGNARSGCSENVIEYCSNDVFIKIAYRLYFIEPDVTKVDELTEI